MYMHNNAADRWARDQDTAREIVDGLDMRDGELISPWATEREDETELECGESTVAEIRRSLPTEWTAEVETDGLVLRPAVVRCACGRVTGELCAWEGLSTDTVLVEWMPPGLRDSHASARSAGEWPHNGSLRLRMHPDCADAIVSVEASAEPEGFAWATYVD